MRTIPCSYGKGRGLTACELNAAMLQSGLLALYPELLNNFYSELEMWLCSKEASTEMIEGEIRTMLNPFFAFVLHAMIQFGNEGLGKPKRLFALEEIQPAIDFPRERLDSDMEKRKREGELAGMVLLNVWRLDQSKRDGSINKSIHIIEKMRCISQTSIRKAWKKYKCVSHYFASCVALGNAGITIDLMPKEWTDIKIKEYTSKVMFHIISWSKCFLDYATERIDKRTSNRLIEINDAYYFDSSIIESAGRVYAGPRAMLSRWDLTAAEIHALASYKANSRY
ncbi:MAG: hypothetical protein ACOY4F_12485 [Thermodesulfobacteriota bacterium]